MKRERARVGAKVLNKVNGKLYLITDETAKGAIGELIIEEDPIFTDCYDTVTINEKNAICFRCVFDPNPVVPEGYTVERGVLLNSNTGEVITEQGQIYIKSIIGAIPGHLLLECAAKKEEKVDIKLYDISRDIFKNVVTCSSPSVVSAFDQKDQGSCMTEGLFLSYSSSNIKEEDGKPVEYFEEAGVVYISNQGKVVRCEYESPLGKILKAFDDYLFIESTTECFDGIVIPAAKAVIIVQVADNKDSITFRKMNISMDRWIRIIPFYINTKGFVVATDKEILVLNCSGSHFRFNIGGGKQEFLLTDFVLVDTKTEKETKKLLFADKDFHMKEIAWTHSSDRGDIVHVTTIV